MENQLQIGLQDPPWRNAGLVSDFEHCLVAAYNPAGACEQNLIAVQAPSGITYPAIARRYTQ
jgi:hypothetical protein